MEYLKDLGINILSIIIGGWIAYKLARWQIEANNDNASRNNQVLLRENIARVREEIKKNAGTVSELASVLDKSKNSRMDLLDWGMTYVDTFSFFSYHHLNSSQLSILLPTPIEKCIFHSYNELETLKNAYKQSMKAQNFHLGNQASQEAADNEFSTIKANISDVRNKLLSNLNQIEKFNA